jgi:hypothetical protein
MPVPFPTSTLYRWATNTLNRVAPTAAEKTSGFRGGDPVPALQTNDLIGSISDWIRWIALGYDTADTVVHWALALAPFRAGTDTSVTLDNILVDVERTGGSGAGSALAIAGPFNFGGQLTSVTADVGDSIVGTDNGLKVQIFNKDSLQATYEKDDIDAGDSATTVALALDTVIAPPTFPESGGIVDVSGPYYLIVTASAGSSVNDTLRFTTITLTFG